jgi:hypothetical protein
MFWLALIIKHAAAKKRKCGSGAGLKFGSTREPAKMLACRRHQLAVASYQQMNTATIPNGRAHLALGEIFSFAYETFMSNKVRFALTALGMVIGTASLILVTTIGLTGKQYLLNQIQAIGSNWVYAEYESGGERITNTGSDALTIDDMEAVQHQVSGIAYASPVVPLNERVPAAYHVP